MGWASKLMSSRAARRCPPSADSHPTDRLRLARRTRMQLACQQECGMRGPNSREHADVFFAPDGACHYLESVAWVRETTHQEGAPADVVTVFVFTATQRPFACSVCSN